MINTHTAAGRFYNKIEKYNVLVILTMWLILFGPYILFGGFIKDDWGFLVFPRDFSNYFEYQWFLSSMSVLTTRPVSAILIGVSYWVLGSHAWAYHFINLAFFAGSILLFYQAIKKVLSPEIALLTATFILICPTVSVTLFSAILMNLHFAALLWSGALYLATKEQNIWRVALSALLLSLASFSYEAFIPLFLLNILFGFLSQRMDRAKPQKFLVPILPVFISVSLKAMYLIWGEKLIFGTQYSRMQLAPPLEMLHKYYTSVKLGAWITLVDSIEISMRALTNLELLSAYYLIAIFVFLGILGLHLYKYAMAWKVRQSTHFAAEFIHRHTTVRIEGFPYLDALVMAVVILGGSYVIYAISDYVPNSLGYESRTLGAIRFSTAFLMAIVIQSAYHSLRNTFLKKSIILLLFVAISFFAVSMLGQREAWIAAARYNDYLLGKIALAIREHRLDDEKSLTLVADLPDEFPNQINQEPIFGVPWDLGPALSLVYPDIKIDANVYWPQATVADADGIVIHGYWRAAYPFSFYVYQNDAIYTIESEDDWLHTLESLP